MILADISIPLSVLLALGGIIIVGGVLTGLVCVSGFGLTLLSIWNVIKPRTEHLAEKTHVVEVENRLAAQVLENKRNTNEKFDAWGKEFGKLSDNIHELSERVVDLTARMGGPARKPHESRTR